MIEIVLPKFLHPLVITKTPKHDDDDPPNGYSVTFFDGATKRIELTKVESYEKTLVVKGEYARYCRPAKTKNSGGQEEEVFASNNPIFLTYTKDGKEATLSIYASVPAIYDTTKNTTKITVNTKLPDNITKIEIWGDISEWQSKKPDQTMEDEYEVFGVNTGMANDWFSYYDSGVTEYARYLYMHLPIKTNVKIFVSKNSKVPTETITEEYGPTKENKWRRKPISRWILPKFNMDDVRNWRSGDKPEPINNYRPKGSVWEDKYCSSNNCYNLSFDLVTSSGKPVEWIDLSNLFNINVDTFVSGSGAVLQNIDSMKKYRKKSHIRLDKGNKNILSFSKQISVSSRSHIIVRDIGNASIGHYFNGALDNYGHDYLVAEEIIDVDRIKREKKIIKDHPISIFWNYFNTSDKANFKITKKPDFNESEINVMPFDCHRDNQIYLMPRRWLYWTRTTQVTTAEKKYHQLIQCRAPCLGGDTAISMCSPPFIYRDDLYLIPSSTYPQLRDGSACFTLVCGHVAPNIDYPLDTNRNHERIRNIVVKCAYLGCDGGFCDIIPFDWQDPFAEGRWNCWTCYDHDVDEDVMMAGDVPVIFEDYHMSSGCLHEAPCREGGTAHTYFHVCNTEGNATYFNRDLEYYYEVVEQYNQHKVGVWWDRFPHDMFALAETKTNQSYKEANGIYYEGDRSWSDAKLSVTYSSSKTEKARFADIKSGLVNAHYFHQKRIVDWLHDFSYNVMNIEYDSFVAPVGDPCIKYGKSPYSTVVGNEDNYRVRMRPPYWTSSSGLGAMTYRYNYYHNTQQIWQKITGPIDKQYSQDNKYITWEKDTGSHWWREHGTHKWDDSLPDAKFNRWDNIPYGVGLSPTKAGDLVGIIKSGGSVYFVWRKTDEKLKLLYTTNTKYPGHKVTFEGGQHFRGMEPCEIAGSDEFNRDVYFMDPFLSKGLREVDKIGYKTTVNQTSFNYCTQEWAQDNWTTYDSSNNDYTHTLDVVTFPLLARERALYNVKRFEYDMANKRISRGWALYVNDTGVGGYIAPVPNMTPEQRNRESYCDLSVPTDNNKTEIEI